jgi:hypothetical protein
VAGLVGRLCLAGELHLHRVQPSANGISVCPLASDDLFRPVRPALGSGRARLGCFRRLYRRMGVGELGLHRVEAFLQSIDLGALARDRLFRPIRPSLSSSSVGYGSIDPGIGCSPIGVGRVRPCRGSVGACVRLVTLHIGRIGA